MMMHAGPHNQKKLPPLSVLWFRNVRKMVSVLHGHSRESLALQQSSGLAVYALKHIDYEFYREVQTLLAKTMRLEGDDTSKA